MFRILEPGPLTTVQDLGRRGFQKYGVPVSGSLDQFAHRVANWLVANEENAAVLELTFAGPRMEALSDGLCALTGAEMLCLVNSEARERWTSFLVKPGDIITIKAARRGIRGYLAVSGGVGVPEVMGSRSTYLYGRMGGFLGRPLVSGDVIPRAEALLTADAKRLPERFVPVIPERIELRAVAGPQDEYFDTGLETFFSSVFKVRAEANRMGYRLEGPAIEFKANMSMSIISEPSVPGVVQVPPDGRPIIILGEQTIGGYAKIATVITPDLTLIAQARPGDTLEFRRIPLSEAYDVYADYRNRLSRIQSSLGLAGGPRGCDGTSRTPHPYSVD